MRVIFFDLDGTLVDSTNVFTAVFAQVVGRFGYQPSTQEIKRAMDQAWPWYEAQLNQYHQKGALAFWQGFNQQVCLGLGANQDARGMALEITETFRKRNFRKLYADVLPCLRELQQRGFTLGVITARPDAREVTDSLDISCYFDHIVDACSANAAKLDERIYNYARQQAQLDPGQAIHVGDEIERDVWPAHAAGLVPILLDRERRHSQTEHLRITDLDSLPALVSSLSESAS